MKTLNNSNLTLTQVLQSVVGQSVNDILIQEGLKSGDENPVKGLTDVKKKGAKGKVVNEGNAPAGYTAVRLDDGQVVNVEIDRGWYRLDESTGGNSYNENQEIEIDYDPSGNAYIIASKQPITTVFLKARTSISLSSNLKNGIYISENAINLGDTSGNMLGGLIKIEKLTDKLNELIDAINQLATSYKSHTHNVTAVGSPSGPVTPPYTGIFNRFNSVDYENGDIVHHDNPNTQN